ncbi:MAG: ATP-binding protein [Proteobacteria bacterium]|nr:ATP-binding protein [Pseudomonadota bacterium]
MSSFMKAERKRKKARVGFDGPAGSGKTYSALLFAFGLGGRVAVIDTEHSSAELYSDLGDFDVAILKPPFSPQRYISLIKEAEAAGYDVLIVDSLSHAWAGVGGILDIKDKRAKVGSNNDFTAWREVTPMHNQLVDTVLQCPCHVLVTMRTKTVYEVQENKKGKMAPVKIGQAPIQREGMDYEFDLVFDLSVDGHVATATKDRTRQFKDEPVLIDSEAGRRLAAWLDSGAEPAARPEAPETARTTGNGASPSEHFASGGNQQDPPPAQASSETIDRLEKALIQHVAELAEQSTGRTIELGQVLDWLTKIKRLPAQGIEHLTEAAAQSLIKAAEDKVMGQIFMEQLNGEGKSKAA